MASESYSGACHCGAVRIEARGAPARVGLCHCIDCRKDTGAPFAAFASFPKASVTVTGAGDRVFRSSPHMRRHFCASCGSSLYLTEDGDDLVYINIGVLDDPGRLEPTYELWTIRKLPWLADMPHLTSFERN